MKPPTADEAKNNKRNDMKFCKLQKTCCVFYSVADLNPQPLPVNICLSTCLCVCATLPEVFVLWDSHSLWLISLCLVLGR